MRYRGGLRRLLLAGLVIVARVARADELDRLPGTGDDPVRALEVFPGIELVPVAGVPSAIAIRDAAPDQNRLLFDGFEIPTLLVGGRSVMFSQLSRVWVEADGFGVEHGRATGGLVDVISQPAERTEVGAELTPVDATLHAGLPQTKAAVPGVSIGVRGSFFEPIMRRELELDGSQHYLSAEMRYDWRLGPHDHLTFSGLLGTDHQINFARDVLAYRHHEGPWSGLVAASLLQIPRPTDVTSIDTRAELQRDLGTAGGLHALEVRAGEDSTYDFHRTNAGAWAATTAALTKDIVLVGGLRLDAFDSQLALQPRGMLAVHAGATTVRLAGGTYRRPAVLADTTPQRATQIALSAEHRVGLARIETTAYYVDRERLVVGGKATGVATNVGLEVRAVVVRGAWRGRLGASVSHATRADTPTAPSHAADYDLPVHADALASWSHGAWQLGARAQLRAGLPYTPVVGAVYDADADTYTPLYGKVMSQRAPYRSELDLRVDRYVLPNLRAYLDVALGGGVLGYAYSYDYTERLPVRAPAVIPWVGLAGTL